MRDALLGISRFDEFQERLGISRNVLERLAAWSTRAFEKVAYQDHPPRHDYVLTEQEAGPLAGPQRHAGVGRPMVARRTSTGLVHRALRRSHHRGAARAAPAVRSSPSATCDVVPGDVPEPGEDLDPRLRRRSPMSDCRTIGGALPGDDGALRCG